jgi:hypothetical protein
MRSSMLFAAVLFTVATNASAATISFVTDPFEGSNALTTPGRQIVANELFTDFDIASDVFAFDPIVFGIGDILFANDVVGNLPTSGINTVVLRTFDNDADLTTPFGAGNAANLIAAQITSSAPGLFIYFNSGLDLPRLVYSTDLGDNTADLKILARFTNLGGQPGRDALAGVSAANFAINPVPEPGSLLLITTAGALSVVCRYARRKRTRA